MTTPTSFFAFWQVTNIDMVAPRKALLVADSEAHSLSCSQDVQKTAPDSIAFVVAPGAGRVDLYDRKDLIPFDLLDDESHQEPSPDPPGIPGRPMPPPVCRARDGQWVV